MDVCQDNTRLLRSDKGPRTKIPNTTLEEGAMLAAYYSKW